MSLFIKLYKDQPFSKKLSITESVILSYIIDLSQKQKYCYANNEALAEMINCNVSTIARAIKKLKDEDIIYTRVPNQQRRIYLHDQYIHLLTNGTKTAKEEEASKKRAYAQAMSHKTKNERIKLLEDTVAEQSREIAQLKERLTALENQLNMQREKDSLLHKYGL